MLYAAPMWIESINKEYNRAKYIRVQRLISLRIANAYRTISQEALCILTGLTSINIKGEEVATLYNITTGRNNQKFQMDEAEKPRNVLHPADIDSIKEIKEDDEEPFWQIYTDGSKSEQGVGSGVAVFKGKALTDQLKFKLDKRCSNNQAEQLAIVKALEALETQTANHNAHKTAVIYTDIKITMNSIRSAKNHNYSVAEIMKRAVNLNKKNWRIGFKWVKADVGIYGNEIADRLAKEATKNRYETYSRLPKCAIKMDNRQQSIKKWQRQWEETTKGGVTKEFFPSVEGRLAVILNLSPDITAIMTGHGNIRSYLHRLKIIGCPECPCKHGTQTVDHLIFKCERLVNERAYLKSSVLKMGKWPVSKSEPTNRYLKLLLRYINSIELEKINQT
jgi:ribonuclease HI